MNYTFENIAGYQTEKQELERLCEIFNHREAYMQKGAKLPKGIIFYGEAGMGKTLFAKVMASVCGLEVQKIDLGSVTDESIICKSIRKAFVKAWKKKKPTMIFFDEMDKVLPNAAEEYYTDRSKTILSQLLTLIDGMDSIGNVVFVATCNDYNSLPETLTRPGRIDKKIHVSAPDYASRVAIFNLYMKRSSCQFETSAEEAAKICAGFSCAAIETLVNECVLRSDTSGKVGEALLRECSMEIKNEDIPRKTSSVDDAVEACSSIGTFLVARSMQCADSMLRLDGDACGEFFKNLLDSYSDDYDDYDDYDDDDDYNDEGEGKEDGASRWCYSKAELINAITVMFGAYVAQELVFHKVYDNLREMWDTIDNLLLAMAELGMLGAKLRFSSSRQERLPYVQSRIDAVNAAFDEIEQSCYEQAKGILFGEIENIKKLMPILVEKKAIDAAAVEALLQDNP